MIYQTIWILEILVAFRTTATRCSGGPTEYLVAGPLLISNPHLVATSYAILSVNLHYQT